MNSLSIGILLLLQSVISIKPGFVHFADGTTNVRKFEQLDVGKMLQTGPDGRVEIGLGLDSLFRLDENSTAVLEPTEADDVSVRLESGTGLVEVEKLDKPHRIHVTAGNLKIVIDSRGVFRFSKDTASVIDGKLAISGSSMSVQKGWEVRAADGDYRQSKVVLNTPQVFKNYLSSPRAGFVNAVFGDANVQLSDTVHQDQPVQTGQGGYVELLLRPGAFLRLDENSSIMIDSATSNDVVVHVVTGSALLENIVADERLPIRVTIGGTKSLVTLPGLYRFTSDTASVIDGALRFGKNGEAVFTGMQVHIVDKVYDTSELKDDPEPGGLDKWSRQRSHLLAKANFLADFADSQANFFLFLTDRPLSAAWIYSPSINGITVMPQLKRESHYGNSFVPSYPLIPTPPTLPPNVTRTPPLEPILSNVTPSPGTQPAAAGASSKPAAPAPPAQKAPGK
jgi:hypothetical protein